MPSAPAATDYVTKPPNDIDLLARVRSALGLISKPIYVEQLRSALSRAGSRRHDKQAESSSKPTDRIHAPGAGVDDSALEESVDQTVLSKPLRRPGAGEVVSMFLIEARALLQELRAAVDSGSAAQLSDATHRLKGSCGIVGARRAASLAAGLERIGRGGVVADAAAATLDQLQQEFERAGGVLALAAPAEPFPTT